MKISLTLRPGNTEEIMTQLRTHASKLISATGCGLFQSAADSTPVRSGRAHANWICSVGTPQFSSDDNRAYDPGRAQTAFADAAPGDILYITNSFPYIGQLENGWSVQAPDGISGRAISICAANFESGVYLP